MIRRSISKIRFQYLITVLLLIFAFRLVEFRALSDVVSQVKPSYLAFSLLLGISSTIAGGFAWWLLTQALNISLGWREFGRIYAAGLFLASFTPGGIGGDISRTYQIHRLQNRGPEAASSIVVSRILSTVSLILLSVVLGGIVTGDLIIDRPVNLFLILGSVVLIAAVGFHLIRRWISSSHQDSGIQRWIGRMMDSLAALRDKPGTIVATSGVYLVHHLLVVFAFYMAALAIGVDVPLLDMMGLVPLIRLAALLPISINGFGVQESAFLVLFDRFDVVQESLLTLSIVGHLVLMPIPIIGGLLLLFGRNSRAT